MCKYSVKDAYLNDKYVVCKCSVQDAYWNNKYVLCKYSVQDAYCKYVADCNVVKWVNGQSADYPTSVSSSGE